MRDGDRERVSGYVVAVISVLESRAVTLVSCYLATSAGPRPSRICACCPGGPGRLPQRVLEALAGQSHARACLLDHAAELRDALAELLEDEQVSVELAEETLEQAARVWSAEHD